MEKATPYEGEPWVLDNGAFSAWRGGRPFDGDRFSLRAAQAIALAPHFGVLPDMVGAGLESLRLSMSWVERLPSVIPWYLPVQDGMGTRDVASALPGLAGLFLGGTTAFKSTARAWSDLAHANGIRFHYARVSGPSAILRAIESGADSCDSSQGLWSKDHWRRFERAVVDGLAQVPLFSSERTC